MKTGSVVRLTHESSLPDVFASQAGVKIKVSSSSARKNVMSMRELFCPDPLAAFEKMAGFQIFFGLKIKCFHS